MDNRTYALWKKSFSLVLEKWLGCSESESTFLRAIEILQKSPHLVQEHKLEFISLFQAFAHNLPNDLISDQNVLKEYFGIISQFAPYKNHDGIRVRDLRGVECPRNFAKVSLELEKLQISDLLEIWLDSGMPIENVPASVVAIGHRILSRKKKEDYWVLLIEKCITKN